MDNEYQEFPCDICGNTDAVEVPHSSEYTNDQPIHICRYCGFVYVKKRRSAEKIAEVWSHDIFGSGYTAAIPAVKARLTYVAEFLATNLEICNKIVCEIGAGEGEFLNMIREPKYGALPFGIEPASANCERLRGLGIDCYEGTIEQYVESQPKKADVVVILWTLENCQSCRAMVNGALQLLKDGGHVVIATGSRLLVPFKKPLHYYLSSNPADAHAFRFSANTLRALLSVCKFDVVHVNRYIDHDILYMIAQKTDGIKDVVWNRDHYLDIYNFFERWHVDTKMYYNI